MRVNRHRLNGGLISQELAYSADLEKYHNAMLNADNVIVSGKGDIAKRNGTRMLDTLDSYRYLSYSNLPTSDRITIIPFSVGQEDNFIVFIDADGIDEGGTTGVVNLRVYKILEQDESLETLLEPQLFGTEDHFETTIFADIQDMSELQYVQSFNALYLAHSDLKPSRLVRFTDGTWDLEDLSFEGGPMQSQNTDTSQLVHVALNQWETATDYVEGDVVGFSPVEESILNGSSSSNIFWKHGHYLSYHDTRINVPGHTMQVGTEFIIDGTTYLDGKYRVKSISGDVITFNRGSYNTWAGEFVRMETEVIGPNATVRHNTTADIDNQFEAYTALVDHTSALVAELNDPAIWRKDDFATGRVLLKSNVDLFDPDDIGGKFSITQVRDSSIKRGTFSVTNATSRVWPVTGEVILKTGGRWDGNIVLESSLDGEEWKIAGSVASNKADTNKEIERVFESGTLVRVRMQSYSATGYTDPSGCQWSLIMDATFDSYFEFYEYIDARTIEVITENNVSADLLTSKWSFGSFSKRFGYPAAVTFNDERLMYGGTETEPFTLWGSEIDSFHNFTAGTLATSPITFKLLSDSICNIRWFSSNRGKLIIGTDSSEYTLAPRTKDELVSGSNFIIEKQSDYGTTKLQPVRSSNTMFYVQRSGENIRTFQYNYDIDGYASPDHTQIAPQVAENGIKSMAFQRTPDNTLWVVDSIGDCYAYAFNQEQKIMAWTKQEFGADEDKVVKVITLPSEAGDRVIVLRYSNVALGLGWKFGLSIEMINDEVILDKSTHVDVTNYTVEKLRVLDNGLLEFFTSAPGGGSIPAPGFRTQFAEEVGSILYENAYQDFASGAIHRTATGGGGSIYIINDETSIAAQVQNNSVDLDGDLIRDGAGVVYKKDGVTPLGPGEYRWLINTDDQVNGIGDEEFYLRSAIEIDLKRYVSFDADLDNGVKDIDGLISVYADGILLPLSENPTAPFGVEIPPAGTWGGTDTLYIGNGLYDRIEIGYPYTMKITPTPLPMDNQNLQIAVALKAMYLYMIESGGGRIGHHYMWEEPTYWEDIDVRTEEEIQDNIEGNLTGRKLVQLTSKWMQDMVFTIESDQPTPFKLASIAYEFGR